MIDEIFRLYKELSVGKHNLFLVGDGSGTILQNCAGWACIAFDLDKTEVTTLYGSLSCGTNNVAELIPYIQGLYFYESRRNPLAIPKPAVVIVSDSEVTVKCGNDARRRRSNLAWWAAIEYFERSGYTFTWKHVPRNSNLLSKRCDWIAGLARVDSEKLKIQLTAKNERCIIK